MRGSIGVAPYSAAVYATVAVTAVVTAAAQGGLYAPAGRTLHALCQNRAARVIEIL